MKTENMFENIKAFVFDVDGVFTDGSVLAMPDGIFYVHSTQKIVSPSEWQLTMVTL